MTSILIVEDDKPILMLIERILTNAGYTPIFSAETGQAALDILQAQHPALVLLDLGLPGAVKGEDILRFIRETTALQQTKVIILSAYPSRRREMLDLGADRFLAKPAPPNLLIAAIKDVLGT